MPEQSGFFNPLLRVKLRTGEAAPFFDNLK